MNHSIYIDDWGSMVIGRRDASVTHFDFQMQGPGSEYNPVLTLLGDKFVGIGNTNPIHSLHVIGDLLIELSIAGDSPVFYTGLDGFIGIGNKNPQSRLDVSGNILLDEILEFRGIENSIRCASGNLNFNVAGQNAIVIASNGNVGIGYSNPSAMLHVAGDVIIGGDIDTPEGFSLFVQEGIISEKVRVRLVEEWSDYVFDEDYSLNEIFEVEDYSRRNKHLPGVPSSKQVSKDGIDLGQMDAILLKKIEELTLYIIQQQKEIESLKQQIIHTNSK